VQHPLAGPTAKLEWARYRLGQLSDEIARLMDVAPHQVTHEVNGQMGEYGIVWDPPTLHGHFGLRVGEVAYNLRSALDVLVWALSANPETISRPRPGFPIMTCKSDFDGLGLRMIRGMTDAAQRLVRDHQPYNRGDRADEDPLAVLSELNNADKHRVPTAVILGMEIDTEPIERLFAENPSRFESDHFVVPRGRFLKPGEYVARFRLRDPADKLNVHVEPSAAVDIAFEDRTPVLSQLAEMGVRVEGVIRHFYSVVEPGQIN
jgi:hypothetical protein